MATDVHSLDLQIRPDGAREWQFAAAVLQLHRHPVSWLLGWAGVHTGYACALWDLLRLVTTAVLVVVLLLLIAFAMLVLTEGQKEVWKVTLWIVGGCVYSILISLLYFHCAPT